LYAGHPPDYIVYHELILTSKVYVSTVTAVDPHWLADLGGVFYSIKEKGFSSRDKRITETEFNRKMEIEAKMEEDRQREEDRKQAEVEKTTKKKATINGKKFVTQGAVKKPVIKRRGRGF
jgi:pre-mRNA-splicing factor ATP-dependent RNA helicase DHX38/PRP16